MAEIYKYIILYACSALVNTGVNKFVIWIIPSTVFAFLCATGTSTVMNFWDKNFWCLERMKIMKLSIVVPCYNESENIPLILNRFADVIKEMM